MRSISTNYSRNPQQKVSFFHIFLSDCFELASWIANGERSRRSGLVKQTTAIKNHGKCTEKNCSPRTLIREYDCLAKIGTKEAFTLFLGN